MLTRSAIQELFTRRIDHYRNFITGFGIGEEFTGRISGAETSKNAAVDSEKLQAISTIISRMGGKDCPGY